MDIRLLKRTVLAIVLPIMLLLAPLTAAAEGASVNIAVKDDVRTGNDFTVTVSFSSDKEIGMVSAALAYSKSEMELISTDSTYSGGNGIINISGSPEHSSKSMDIMLRFRALSGGKSDMTLTNGTILAPDGAVIDGSLSAAAHISISGETRPPEPKESTVSEPDSSLADESSSSQAEESSLPDESSSTASEADSSSMIPDDGGKARLTSITVTADKQKEGEKPETFRLKPEFSPDIFDYEVTVHNDTEYISVDAVLKDKIDTIWYDGSVYLPVGMTPWTITVTTPDGTVSHAYNLRVIRHEEGYIEESSSDESSSAATTTVTKPAEPAKSANQAETPKIPEVTDPNPYKERPLREKLMPVLIIAICVIAAAVLFIVIRIRMRSKNQLGNRNKK